MAAKALDDASAGIKFGGKQGAAAALASAKDAAKKFKDAKDVKGEADATRCVIIATSRVNGSKEALALATTEHQRFETAKNGRGQGAALSAASEVLSSIGQVESAMQMATQAQGIFLKEGSLDMEALSQYKTMFDVNMASGDAQGALNSANQAVSIAERSGDKKVEAAAWHAVTVARLAKGSEEAVAAAEEALDLFKELGDKVGQAATLCAMAQAQLLTGKVQKAMQAADESLQLFKSLGLEKGVTEATVAICDAYIASGEPKEGTKMAKAEISKLQQVNDREGEITLGKAVVSAHIAAGDDEAALRVAKSLLKALKDMGDEFLGKEEAIVGRIVGEVHIMRQEYEMAIGPLKESAKSFQGRKDKQAAESVNYMIDRAVCAQGNVDKSPFRAEAMTHIRDMARAIDDKSKDKFEEAYGKLKKLGAGYVPEDIERVVNPAIQADTEGEVAWLKDLGLSLVLGPKGEPDTSKFFLKSHMYMYYRFTGLGYGPRFRCMEQNHRLKRGQTPKGIAVIQLQDVSDGWEEMLTFSPMLIDCGLQSMAVGSLNF
eukprot:gnl/TRDRNA2_/TRDRNA2_179607_c0_seq1.p1 gnl/TRDRNA2_/TRDRNA2_179607_c0~~gnl/TRDRNA2_/TRDRNA2_179607_c0_seq1.p1  ORF type:complete len:567 (+),score=181.25 gnl/TRDRNA2_/TRDRNA2_179607_c0_seq1:63-1703(+)